MYSRKETIPLHVKIIVWIRCMYSQDNRIAQCHTCEKFVRYPESLRNCFRKPLDILCYPGHKSPADIHGRIPIDGNAQFGHVISEHHGGSVSSDNLVIQCGDCNRRQGIRNIEPHMKADIVFLNTGLFIGNNDGHKFIDDERTCLGITVRGTRCKNKCASCSYYCHQHLHN